MCIRRTSRQGWSLRCRSRVARCRPSSRAEVTQVTDLTNNLTSKHDNASRPRPRPARSRFHAANASPAPSLRDAVASAARDLSASTPARVRSPSGATSLAAPRLRMLEEFAALGTRRPAVPRRAVQRGQLAQLRRLAFALAHWGDARVERRVHPPRVARASRPRSRASSRSRARSRAPRPAARAPDPDAPAPPRQRAQRAGHRCPRGGAR